MKIPHKTKYKLVKRQRIRDAVTLRHWRNSYVGLHKTLGIFVQGRDIANGKYKWDDLQTVGYGMLDKGYVIPADFWNSYHLKQD